MDSDVTNSVPPNAATSPAVDSALGPSVRRPQPESRPIVGDTGDNDAAPRSPLVPDQMHRADADAQARATSAEFHDRRDGATVEPPSASEAATGGYPPRSDEH